MTVTKKLKNHAYLELSSVELSLLFFLVFGVGSGSETTKSDILSPLLSLEVKVTGLRFFRKPSSESDFCSGSDDLSSDFFL